VSVLLMATEAQDFIMSN